jgi:DNA-binding MarR family transcriptional regulator
MVADEMEISRHESVGAWAKRYYFANRAMIESVLRPYGLGSTQWYVLYQLATDGPTMQRDLAHMLHLERATLSAVVATLVRKGFVDQMPDSADQRQRVLRITAPGMKLWEDLPDPLALIQKVAYDGADGAEVATAVRVLRAATQRLNDHLSGGNQPWREAYSAGAHPGSSPTKEPRQNATGSQASP